MSLQLSSIALAGFHGHCWNHRYPLRTQFELTIGSLTLILIRSLATYTSLMLYTTDLAPSTGSWASTNDGKTKEDRKEEKKSQLRSRTVSSSFRLLRLSRRRKPMPFQKRDSRCLAASSYRAACRHHHIRAKTLVFFTRQKMAHFSLLHHMTSSTVLSTWCL